MRRMVDSSAPNLHDELMRQIAAASAASDQAKAELEQLRERRKAIDAQIHEVDRLQGEIERHLSALAKKRNNSAA